MVLGSFGTPQVLPGGELVSLRGKNSHVRDKGSYGCLGSFMDRLRCFQCGLFETNPEVLRSLLPDGKRIFQMENGISCYSLLRRFAVHRTVVHPEKMFPAEHSEKAAVVHGDPVSHLYDPVLLGWCEAVVHPTKPCGQPEYLGGF